MEYKYKCSYVRRLTLWSYLDFLSELSEDIIAARDPSTETLDDPRYIPARRVGTEGEMKGTILYLASKAGAFCNGLMLVHDGGRLAVTTGRY